MSGYCDHGLSSEKTQREIIRFKRGILMKIIKTFLCLPLRMYYLSIVKLTQTLSYKEKSKEKIDQNSKFIISSAA
jgi:hypothetical protein